MSSKTFSLIVRGWYDIQTDTTQVQVVRADTTEKVRLLNGSFLLRISVGTRLGEHGEAVSIIRCFIRHLATGREAHVQGGGNLHTFIKDCLLHGNESDSKLEGSDPDVTGENGTPVQE